MPDWLIAHLVAIAKVAATGGFSTENTKPIDDIVKRAPITTRQFVEDFKACVCLSVSRHGRACPGHPRLRRRLAVSRGARHKAGQ